jgi:DNA repair protein RadD
MLRPYQIASIDCIRQEFAKGKNKVLLKLATGAGKTTIFCDILKNAAAKGNRCIVVVRGRKLVDQASQRLIRESVEHGVIMNGHWNYRPHLPNQVCSIDTVISRRLRPEADLIIIDEAHLAISDGYKKFLSQYPKAFILAVTATPYVDKSLRHVADTVIAPITMQELIDQKYLVPFRYFSPSIPNLDNVKISSSTKDYVTDQLEMVMSAGNLTGKVIDHWRAIAEGRPTICFAVNVRHSMMLAERFKSAGIAAEHCDADTRDSERVRIIRDLESGRIKVVTNVGIFCTGVDIPPLGAIIMARPTKSKNLYIQQAGRGTRTFPGKDNCILLDHSGNILRHGFPTEEWEVDLDGKPVSKKTINEAKTCSACFAVFLGKVCPECKTEIPIVMPKEIHETDEKLKEVKFDPIAATLRKLKDEAKRTGRKPGWAFYELIRKYGFEEASPYIDRWFLNHYTNPKDSPFANSPFTACQVESNVLKR